MATIYFDCFNGAGGDMIVGALLDAVSTAMRQVGKIHLPAKPRMADFAEWAIAAERSLGLEQGQFMAAYANLIDSANALAIES